jgi:hypothetical protein
VIMKRINLESMDVNIFSTPKYEKLVLGMLYVHLCASLVPEKLDRVYSYSVIESLSNKGRCLLNMNILAP